MSIEEADKQAQVLHVLYDRLSEIRSRLPYRRSNYNPIEDKVRSLAKEISEEINTFFMESYGLRNDPMFQDIKLSIENIADGARQLQMNPYTRLS